MPLSPVHLYELSLFVPPNFAAVVVLTITSQPVIIRPYRCATYVDAAYCNRPSSVVCLSVGRFVGLSQ